MVLSTFSIAETSLAFPAHSCTDDDDDDDDDDGDDDELFLSYS